MQAGRNNPPAYKQLNALLSSTFDTNKMCGWLGDADFNGAKMIELWGCSVNQPRDSELLSCAIEPGLPKAPSALASMKDAANQLG